MPSKVSYNSKAKKSRRKKEQINELNGSITSTTTTPTAVLGAQPQQQTMTSLNDSTNTTANNNYHHVNTNSPTSAGASCAGGNSSSSSNHQHHHQQQLHHNNHNNHEYNRKITDYFQIRKSTRKCKSDIEKERRQQIEESIKLMKEDGLEVRHLKDKGRGIFSTRPFERGEYVCEYAGEMISYKTAKKREELYANDQSVGCYMYFFEYKSKQYCIDATAETTRLGRLLNHSKLGGNCQTKLFEIDSKPHLILIASRRIETGEEMTYDYGDRNKLSIEFHPWLAQ